MRKCVIESQDAMDKIGRAVQIVKELHHTFENLKSKGRAWREYLRVTNRDLTSIAPSNDFVFHVRDP